jgi:hypothetical protein
MGKITQEQRTRYAEKVKEQRKIIESGLAKEKTLLDLLAHDDNGAAYKRLHLAEEVLDLSSWYLLVNTLSVSMLGIKNEDYLIEGRKVLVRGLKYVEDTTTAYLDCPVSDYEKNLDAIADMSLEARYRLVRKFGFAIQSYEDAFGENSKYSMSFIELWGKYAAIAKNFIDLRTAVADSDFSSPQRPVVLGYLAVVKDLLQRSADRYREKYELYTNKFEDFKLAITYLQTLRRVHVALGERDDAETLKKKIDVWSAKLDADAKRVEAGPGPRR